MPIVFDSVSDNAAPRFIALVNRLLPPGVRFSISPVPQNRQGEGRGLLSGHPLGAVPWKRNFASMLGAQLAPGPRDVRITLTEADRYQVLVGQFGNAGLQTAEHNIDVADVAAMPDEFAAMALIHELEEQRQAQLFGQPQARAHRTGLLAEWSVTGMNRLRGLRSGPPEGDSTARRGAWKWWIAHRRQNGAIETLMLDLFDYEIGRATTRSPRFASLEEFNQAAAANGLTVEF